MGDASNILTLIGLFVGGPALIWWLRRGNHGFQPSLRVVSRTALTKSSVVAIVEADGERLLIGATDQGISVLRTLEPVEDTEPSSASPISDDRPGNGPLDALRAITTRRAAPPGSVRVR